MEDLSFDQQPEIQLSNEQTFDLVYRSYYAPLCFFAHRFVARKDAEDVVNALFLKLWDRQLVFQSSAHIQSFLYLAVKNACLDQIKLCNRRDRRSGDYLRELEEVERSYEQEIIYVEFWAELYREINRLPPQCASVISMSYLDGLTNSEVAKILEISLQTVKNHKTRGMKILKAWLKDKENVRFTLLFLLFFGQS